MSSSSARRKRSEQFGGFEIDTGTGVTLPSELFTDVLPHITTIEELQVLLTVLRMRSGDLEKPISENDVADDRDLRFALRVQGNPQQPDERILRGLELSLARGTLLRFLVEAKPDATIWYYVNTPRNRATLSRIQAGTLAPPEVVWTGSTAPRVVADLPNAFRLYEQNIGTLTPMIADQIRLAIEEYPADWIEEAIGEAVAYNRRNWRYIARILENWTVQGKGDPST